MLTSRGLFRSWGARKGGRPGTVACAVSGVALLCGACCPFAPPADQTDLGTGGDDDRGGVVTVRIQDFAFDPPAVTIRAGQGVRWVNEGSVDHTVTSGSPGVDGDAGQRFDVVLSPGDIVFLKFSAAAVFVYHCRFHPEQMRDATVTVTAGN